MIFLVVLCYLISSSCHATIINKLSYSTSIILTNDTHTNLTLSITTISSPQTIHSIDSEKNSSASSFLFDRAGLLCSSRLIHHLHDARYVIEQFRLIWKSTLPIIIAHCQELNDKHFLHLLKGNSNRSNSNNANIYLLDICQHPLLFGLDYEAMLVRLRSYFCKAAAIVLAPVKEALLVDLDTIWLQSPERLFQSSLYKSTGALFFRDRFAIGKPTPEDPLLAVNVAKLFAKHSTTTSRGRLSSAAMRDFFIEQGIYTYWQYLVNASLPRLMNYQESSVVLMDRSRHRQTLDFIAKLLPDFSIGWGDKEIYWIAATIAGQRFSFEPFHATLYGCCGAIMHYFPDSPPILEGENQPLATPYYINGEWLVERVSLIGRFFENEMPKPLLASTDFEEAPILRKGLICLCNTLGRQPLPLSISYLLVRAQWERKTRLMLSHRQDSLLWPQLRVVSLQVTDDHSSLHEIRNRTIIRKIQRQDGYMVVDFSLSPHEHYQMNITAQERRSALVYLSKHCITIALEVYPLLVQLMEEFRLGGHCARLGCMLPHDVITTLQAKENLDELCVPVSFQATGPPQFCMFYYILYSLPDSLEEKEIYQKEKSQALYYYLNGSFHHISSFETYQRLKKDGAVLSDRPLSWKYMKKIGIGEPVY